MTKQSNESPQNPDEHKEQLKRAEAENASKKAEAEEVAGRHKNDGKNDNATHKTSR